MGNICWPPHNEAQWEMVAGLAATAEASLWSSTVDENVTVCMAAVLNLSEKTPDY